MDLVPILEKSDVLSGDIGLLEVSEVLPEELR